MKIVKNQTVDWIRVEDTLPHRLERVLVVCYNYTNHMQTHVSLCTFFGTHRGKPIWSGKKCVTHWLPLPELPKDIQQNPRLKEE